MSVYDVSSQNAQLIATMCGEAVNDEINHRIERGDGEGTGRTTRVWCGRKCSTGSVVKLSKTAVPGVRVPRGNHKPLRGAKLHKKSQNFINFIKTSCDELASYDDITSNVDDVIGAGASLSGGGELTPRGAYAKYPLSP